MAAVMLQVIPSFYTIYSKKRLFISANTYEKYFVSKEYCIARHDDKVYFLLNFWYGNILIDNIKDLLQKLDFNYQHVDCLYTLFKYLSWISLFCFQVVRFGDNTRTSLWNFAMWCLFMLSRFPLSRFNMHSQRNWKNSFGQDWRKRLLQLWENDRNTWRVERFCVFIVQKFRLFQPVRDINF